MDEFCAISIFLDEMSDCAMLKSESSPLFGNNVKFYTPNKLEKKEANANESAKTKPEIKPEIKPGIKFKQDESWGWFVDEDDMGAEPFNNHSIGMKRIREEKKPEEFDQEDLQFSMDP